MRLINKEIMPPGGFQYRIAETGYVTGSHTNLHDCSKEARKHLVANRLEVPANLNDLIEEQICERIEANPEWCEHGGARTTAISGKTIGFNEILNSTRALMSWIAKGTPMADAGLASARARQCAGCPMNAEVVGCSACNLNALRSVVESLRGDRRTPYDGQLHGCRVCGCALKVKVWVPSESLQQHYSQRQMDLLRSVNCWACPQPKE